MESSLASLTEWLAPHKRVLVVGMGHESLDVYASVFALGEWLASQQKEVRCVIPESTSWPAVLGSPSLPLHAEIGAFRSLEVHVPLQSTELQELAYRVEDETLRLSLTPKAGMWQEKDVQTHPGAPLFDACVILNASGADVASLVAGEPEWTRALTAIELRSANGPSLPVQHAVVLSRSTGISEALAHMFLERDPAFLANAHAHALLAGILASSRSFRDARVSSDTFAVASELVRRGADRQAIVHALWRTIPVHDLNLWGRAMMRLESHPTLALTSTLLSAHDFLQTKSSLETLPKLGFYLLDRLPTSALVLILSEREGSIRADLVSNGAPSAMHVARWFQGEGTATHAHWLVSTHDLLDAQKQILRILEQELPRLTATT